jgi:integrase
MSRVLKPAAVEAGIGRWVGDGDERRAETSVGFHTFRHTCATGLIADEGWSLEQVQVYLGHADYATTRRYYVHLIPDDLPERTSVRDGNRVATRPTETARNDYPRAKVESA